MKTKLIFTFCLLSISIISFGQQELNWLKWNWLIGSWKGAGSGKPGEGEGTFSFELKLGGKVIERISHSEYSAKDNKPSMPHDDMMIIYMDGVSYPNKAIYFDNEGHAINYSISYFGNDIILTSEKTPTSPVFRLTYTKIDDNTINTRFEMSQDGMKFMIYVEGKSSRVKE